MTRQTYLVEIDYRDIGTIRDALDLAHAHIMLRRSLDRQFGKPVRKGPGPLRRRIVALQRDFPKFQPYDSEDGQRLPCFGVHNFVTDEGGDDIEGPAHCTECGAERVDPQ